MNTLWHYTCDHGLKAIERSGWMLQPNRAVTPTLLWLTDLEEPARDGLGLTMRRLKCDRTAHRFEIVEPHEVEHWLDARRRFRPTYVEALEQTPGAMPQHWWITAQPQRAVLHEREVAA